MAQLVTSAIWFMLSNISSILRFPLAGRARDCSCCLLDRLNFRQGGRGLYRSLMHAPCAPALPQYSHTDTGRHRDHLALVPLILLLLLSCLRVATAEIEIMRRPDGSEWQLGAGGYGKVYKALRNGVQPVAVKVLTVRGKHGCSCLLDPGIGNSMMETVSERSVCCIAGFVCQSSHCADLEVLGTKSESPWHPRGRWHG